MRYWRYEVLLPVRYNDGTPVERQKFEQAIHELFERFGGVTFDFGPMTGYWLAPTGQLFEEEMVRLAVDVPDTPKNRDFFVQWKETLKERFRQAEIWMVAISLEVI